ncbi:Clavaminate synthase-like protein, partial [Aureobasidium melanogenum]
MSTSKTKTTGESIQATPVTVSLHDLERNTIPFSTLVAAFGPDSLGILVVKDLPREFSRLRSKVLADASRLAALPPEKLANLTNPTAKYLVGWSHGVETLRPGVVDTAKGSYYVNCAFYQNQNNPSSSSSTDQTTSEKFAEYTAPNIWPDDHDIPGFQNDVEALITLIIDTAVLVARACDRFAENQHIPGYQAGYLERVVRTSTTTKARLLHYFPLDQNNTPEDTNSASASTDPATDPPSDPTADDEDTSVSDTWCTTHLDHGCLTGLTSAMFIDESLSHTDPAESEPGIIIPNVGLELPSSPDPSSGLYIVSRTGQICKVSIPRDCLAFQTGEALELITKGQFKAVPHFVKGVDPNNIKSHVSDNTNTNNDSNDSNNKAKQRKPKIARNTLAVFTQPNLDEVIDPETGLTFGEFASGVVKRNTADGARS